MQPTKTQIVQVSLLMWLLIRPVRMWSEGNSQNSEDSTKNETHNENADFEEEEQQKTTKDTSASRNSEVNPVGELRVGGENVVSDEEQYNESSDEEHELQEAITSKAPDKANEDRRCSNSDLNPSKDGRINVDLDV